MMKQLLGNSYLFGANAPFIEALYEAYLKDPQSVEPRWRGYFDELQRLDDGPRDVSHQEIQERFARLARERRSAAQAVAGPQGQLGEKQAQLKLDYAAQQQALLGPVQARISRGAQAFQATSGCAEVKMARAPDLAALTAAGARDVTGDFVAWYLANPPA